MIPKIMDTVEEKCCGRCNSTFICQSKEINNCACRNVALSEETTIFLAKTYFDCLCNNCLEEINNKVASAGNYAFPSKKEMLIEGLHFYKEGNNFVFTELYHFIKGYCCGNGCRHCVYGYSLKNIRSKQ